MDISLSEGPRPGFSRNCKGTYDYFDYAGSRPFVARAAVTINFIPLSPARCKVLTLFYIDYENEGCFGWRQLLNPRVMPASHDSETSRGTHT